MVSQATKDAFARELSDALDDTGYTITRTAQFIGAKSSTVSNYLLANTFPPEERFQGLVDLFEDVWIYRSRDDCLRVHGEE